MNHRSRSRVAALFASALAASSLISSPMAVNAQDANQGEGVEVREKVITRVYDIADIVYGLRNYPFFSGIVPPSLHGVKSNTGEGGSGGEGGGLFSGSGIPDRKDEGAAARQERTEEVVKLLQDTVSPDSWRDNGGTTGSVREIGGKLVITQTEATHARIAQLLKEIAGSSQTARTVTVSASWLMISPDEAAALMMKDDKGESTRQLDPAALAKLPTENTVFRGSIRCIDGQTVHLTSGTGRSSVLNVNSMVGQNAVGFDPEIELLHAGLALQVTPQVDSEGKTALIDIHSIYSDRRPDGDPIIVATVERGPATRPHNAAGQNSSTSRADRIEVVAQQLQTSLRLKLERPTLVGGMTIEPTDKGDRRQLYLVLDLSVETVQP